MIETATTQEASVVTGTGELDLHVAREFDEALVGAVETGLPVTVDLRDASFVDSAILQSLSLRARDILQRGERMRVLVETGSHPDRVLHTMLLGILFDIVGDDAEHGS